MEEEEYKDEDKEDPDTLTTFMPADMDQVPDHVKKYRIRRIQNFSKKFERFIMQVPSLGFNNGFYETNIAIQYLIRHFNLTNKKVKVIKRGNRYLCMSTEIFRFLDIMQYLPQNTTYSEFLKAFHVPEVRGHFPYQYISTFDKLNDTQLPPIGDAWYSGHKQRSLLDDGVDTIENNYEAAERVWQEHDMATRLFGLVQQDDSFAVNTGSRKGPRVLCGHEYMCLYIDSVCARLCEKAALSGLTRRWG